MTTKTKTRLTAALVARHLAVAVVTNALPSPAEAVARDLLSDIDARRRVKDLTGRCRLVIDTGLKAGALDLVSADGNTKDTRRAVQSIRAVAQLSDQLFGKPDEVKPPADLKPETSQNDVTEPDVDSNAV